MYAHYHSVDGCVVNALTGTAFTWLNVVATGSEVLLGLVI